MVLPYDPKLSCPKCLNQNRSDPTGRVFPALRLTYCAGASRDYTTCELLEEHLHQRCERCHYQFITTCAPVKI